MLPDAVYYRQAHLALDAASRIYFILRVILIRLKPRQGSASELWPPTPRLAAPTSQRLSAFITALLPPGCEAGLWDWDRDQTDWCQPLGLGGTVSHPVSQSVSGVDRHWSACG